jgi:hypothetical protein
MRPVWKSLRPPRPVLPMRIPDARAHQMDSRTAFPPSMPSPCARDTGLVDAEGMRPTRHTSGSGCLYRRHGRPVPSCCRVTCLEPNRTNRARCRDRTQTGPSKLGCRPTRSLASAAVPTDTASFPGPGSPCPGALVPGELAGNRRSLRFLIRARCSGAHPGSGAPQPNDPAQRQGQARSRTTPQGPRIRMPVGSAMGTPCSPIATPAKGASWTPPKPGTPGHSR